jgi:hypothetical protein
MDFNNVLYVAIVGIIPALVLSLALYRLFNARFVLGFILAALVSLIAGHWVARYIWAWPNNARFAEPGMGAYYGKVRARFFDGNETFCSLRFEGKSRYRWYWSSPTNFAYDRLQIDWYVPAEEKPKEGSATVSLPSLVYESVGNTGLLSTSTLTEWLSGSAGNQPSETAKQQVDAIFNYIRAAGSGSLPPPRHHSYYFEDPLDVHIKHYDYGWSFPKQTLVWYVAWLFTVSYCWMRFRRRISEPHR